MAALSLNLTIEQGADFEVEFTITNDDNETPLNLTGYTGSSVLRKHYGASSSKAFTVTIPNAIAGILKLSMSRTITSTLKEGRYVYDVMITSANDLRTRVVQGSVLVTPGVTL
jgi:hypothetical protein